MLKGSLRWHILMCTLAAVAHLIGPMWTLNNAQLQYIGHI